MNKIPSAELTSARDAALPPSPKYPWDWRTRSSWTNYLKVLQARLGQKAIPPGIDGSLPGDGEKPVPNDLWALLLMGREIAIDALGYNPEQLPTNDVATLVQALTSILSRANPKELFNWLESEN
jgi:hypothetical protein